MAREGGSVVYCETGGGCEWGGGAQKSGEREMEVG